MRFSVIVATFGLLVSAPVAGAARADERPLPPELAEHARAHGCRPVADFDTLPGVAGRPFAFGYVPGPDAESAVYWCERGAAESRIFRLMLVLKDGSHEAARCPLFIEWGARIGGLSIETDEATTLDGFVPLDHRARRPERGTHLRHAAIRAEYDGGGWVFYCHEGRWFVQRR